MASQASARNATPAQVFDLLQKRRLRQGVEMVNITVVRRFLKGKTHKRGLKETRGTKTVYSRSNVLAMNAARRKYVRETKGTKQAKWKLVIRKARVPRADPTTAARAFAREGIKVKLRRSREKPQRTQEQEKEREELCDKMRRWPLARFTDQIDMIIDNKRFNTPTSLSSREHLLKQRLVAQLRTPEEGLEKFFTKPSAKRHRKNCGGSVEVCAGISNCKVVLWEYLTKWNGSVAAEMYKGPIMKTLKRVRGEKDSYLLAEDNDPTGYKSSKALTEKTKLHINTITWPRYSPDLMPLDYFLWEDINRRMDKTAPRGNESAAAFKSRLRRTALSTSTTTVRAAVEGMRKRAKAIWEAKGKDIARD